LSTEPPQISDLGRAVQDVGQKLELLVSDEIALAKTELAEKVSKLIKGAVFGIVAGVFALFALIYLLEAFSWGIYDLGWSGTTHYWWGFLIVGVVLLALGGLLGFLAARLVKRGTPPTPQMAVEEGKLIRETLSRSRPAPSRVPGPGEAAR